MVKIVALSVGFVCLLNVVMIFYLARHPVDVGHFLVSRKWELLDRHGPADVLILGDSSAAFAIDPELFEQETGLKCLNLATVGQMLVLNDAWMLDAYIRKYGPPKAVLVAHEDAIWETRNLNAEYLGSVPMEWDFWTRTSPSMVLHRLKKWEIFASRYLPLYSRHLSVARLCRPPYAGPITHLSPNGFPLQPEGSFNPAFHDQANLLTRMKRGGPFTISPVNLAALRVVQQLCRSNSCPLVLVKAPILEEITGRPEFPAYLESVQACFDEVAAGDPNTAYVFHEPYIFGRDEARDSVHLHPGGARRFTLRLIEELSAPGRK